MADLTALLGKVMDDPAVNELKRELGSEPVRTAVEDRHYLSYEKHGISLAANESLRIETVFLYAEGRDGYGRYRGPLPHGLRFDLDRDECRRALGTPAESGGGGVVPLYGEAAPWDLYNYPDHSIHLEFGDRGRGLSLITLSTPEATPRRL